VDPRDPLHPTDRASAPHGGGRRYVWHALAMLAVAALAWLAFIGYRQPDFILDFAGMRLC